MIRLLLLFAWNLVYLIVQFNFLNIDTAKVDLKLFQFVSK